MKSLKLMLLILVFTAPCLILAQNEGDYRTVDNASGLWSAYSNWQWFNNGDWRSAPSAPNASSGLITVRSGADLKINDTRSLDQVVIEAGATVEITQNTTTIEDGTGVDLTVFGKLKQSSSQAIAKKAGAEIVIKDGGVYEHNTGVTSSGIPQSTWEDGSECLLTGHYGTSALILSVTHTCMKQDFYNLTLDYGVPQDNDHRTFGEHHPIDVRNTLKLRSGYLHVATGTQDQSLNVFNLEICGGHFVATRGYGTPMVTIRNNTIVDGGSLNISQTGEGVTRDYCIKTKNLELRSGAIHLNSGSSATKNTGSILISGDFIMKDGVLTNNPNKTGTCAGIYFDGIFNEQSFIWEGGTILNYVDQMFYYKTTGGPLSLNEYYKGSTHQTSISGTGGSPVTGYAKWPAMDPGIKDLYISNPAGVTLSTPKKVNGSLTLDKGLLTTADLEKITLGDGASLYRKKGTISKKPSYSGSVSVYYEDCEGTLNTDFELPGLLGESVHNLGVTNCNNLTLGRDLTLTGNMSVKNSSFDLDEKLVTIPGHNFQLDGKTIVHDFSLECSDEAAAYGEGDVSIGRKWKLAGNFQNKMNIYFSWPAALDNGNSFANGAKLWRHDGNSWVLEGSGLDVTTENEMHTLRSYMDLYPASRVDGMNEYTITGMEQTLPVELSSFTVSMGSSGYPVINWVTQSETNLLGYYLFRNNCEDLSRAERISALIPGQNSSTMQIYTFTDRELDCFGLVYYWLQYVDLDASCHFTNPICFNYEPGSHSPEIPTLSGIKSVYPNPFNPDLTIKYGLERNSGVAIDIYNHRGQLVYHQDFGEKAAGYHDFIWDGKESHGSNCNSGIYFVRIKIGDEIYLRKASLLK